MVTITAKDIIPAAELPRLSPGRTDSIVGVVRGAEKLAGFDIRELPLSDTARAQIDALVAGQQTSAIYANTLADLQSVSGSFVNQGAFVLNGGGAGQYRWTGSSWQFLRGDSLATKADQAELSRVEGEIVNSGATALPQALDNAGSRQYVGSGAVIPLVVDAEDNAIIYWDSEKQGFYVHGVSGVVEQVLHNMGVRGYTGEGPIYPIVTGSNNEVILGYDAEREELVGLASSSAAGREWPDVAALNHFFFYGQSLSVGATAGVTSTTQPFANLTFAGGPRAYTGTAFSFTPVKPLVEDAVNPAPDGQTNRGETPCSGAANYATRLAAEQNGVVPEDHVILASTGGRGAAAIAELVKGTTWYNTVAREHIRQAVAINPDYSLVIGWVQGEADSGSASTVTREQYAALLAQLRRDIADEAASVGADLGGTWLITYQCSPVLGSPNPALAQLDLAQSDDLIAMATPIYHLPRSFDGTHLGATGYKWMGAYFGRAYKRIMHDKKRPEFLNPVAAQLRGNTVRVRFEVPTLPLVLDTTTLAATQDLGFRVADSAGTVAISSVTVDGPEVVILLGGTPVGAVEVRYALDYLGTGLTITNGASGNLRDSTPETVLIAGAQRPLYHVAPHFRLPAIPFKEI